MNANTVILALTMAMSPMPVLASVLLLSTERGRAKAAAFAAGWLGALVVLGIGTLIVAGNVKVKPHSGASKATAAVDVVLGLLAFAYALRLLRKQRAGNVAEPSWMGRLDRMSPFLAFCLGAFLPPYVLVVAGANNIIRSDATDTARLIAVIVFTVVGSVGVLVPLGMAVFSPHPEELLARWRAALLAHWPVILFWLFGAIGVYLVLKGAYEFTT